MIVHSKRMHITMHIVLVSNKMVRKVNIPCTPYGTTTLHYPTTYNYTALSQFMLRKAASLMAPSFSGLGTLACSSASSLMEPSLRVPSGSPPSPARACSWSPSRLVFSSCDCCCDSVLVLALLTHGRTSLPSRSDAHDVDVHILTS